MLHFALTTLRNHEIMSYAIPTPSGESNTASKKNYALIEPGWRDLEVVDATDVDAQGEKLVTRSGDPRIKVRVTTDEGQSFWHFLYLTPKAFPMVWEFLEALGIRPTGEEFVLNPEDMVGKRFRAMIFHDNDWNRLKRPQPIANEQPTPDPEEKPRPLPVEDEEDDVPF